VSVHLLWIILVAARVFGDGLDYQRLEFELMVSFLAHHWEALERILFQAEKGTQVLLYSLAMWERFAQ